jgi:hypothetical protein
MERFQNPELSYLERTHTTCEAVKTNLIKSSEKSIFSRDPLLNGGNDNSKKTVFKDFNEEMFNINFLRKERLYTKLKYSRCPQYDIVSGG